MYVQGTVRTLRILQRGTLHCLWQEVCVENKQVFKRLGMASFVIIGAGPSGLSAAYHLGKDYLVLEKEKEVGGICRTAHLDGFRFDYGGHIIYTQGEYFRQLVMELLGDQSIFLPREAWIYSHSAYTRYPFQANLYGLPVEVVKECILGLVDAKRKFGENRDGFPDFKDFVYKVFGKGIARHFMVPFNLKQWAGTPLKEMTVEWLGSFVPIPSLEKVLEGSLSMAPKCIGLNANFIYPQYGGIQTLFTALSEKLEAVQLRSPVESINLKQRRVTVSGQNYYYEHLIPTIPLVELVKIIEDAPSSLREAAARLKWVSLYVVNVAIERNHISDKHRVYYPEEEFIFHKLGYYQNQSPHMVQPEKSAVSAEISFSPRRSISRESLEERTIADLVKAKVLRPEDNIVLSHVLTLPYAYALYDHYRSRVVEYIRDYLERHHVWLCGRYAQWEYQNMEQNILAGKQLAERLRNYS